MLYKVYVPMIHANAASPDEASLKARQAIADGVVDMRAYEIPEDEITVLE